MSHVFFYDGTDITQVTNGAVFDTEVQTDGSNVFWIRQGGWSPDESEIYLWNGSTEQNLTNNSLNEQDTHIDANGNLVWMGGDTLDLNTFDIYQYDGLVISRITENGFFEGRPYADGGKIAWAGGELPERNNIEIFMYDGDIHQISSDELYDDNPVMSGNRIAWESRDTDDILVSDIYLYDAGDIQCLTDNTGHNIQPAIEGDLLAWESCDLSDPTYATCEIMLYDIGTETLSQITDDTLVDEHPVICEGALFWWTHGADSYNNAKINLWFQGGVHAITSDSLPDYSSPASCAGGTIGWMRLNSLQEQEIAFGSVECFKNCETLKF